MHRTLTATTILALVALQAGTVRAGLVAHWKLDEGSGAIAADATGNGHDGALAGEPAWVEGYLGGALEFDGYTQMVEVPYSPELNPTDEFSVSLWAYVAPNSSGYRSPITSRDDAPQNGYLIYAHKNGTWAYWVGRGSGWNATVGPEVQTGEWTYLAAGHDDGNNKFYVNGALEAETDAAFVANTARVLRIGAGATETTATFFFEGMIDDVRLYNHALCQAEIDAVMANETYPFPVGPKPTNGAMIGTTSAALQWSPGELAASHDVYFGTDHEAVANATPDDTDLYLGSMTDTTLAIGTAGSIYPEVLTPGQTYYWRVDGVDESNPNSPWKSDVWSFWVQPNVAWDPSPADAAPYVLPDDDLSWQEALGALYYTVHFGADFNEVNEAGLYDGFNSTETTFSPEGLEVDTTYYWRVDSFDGAAMQKGEIWSFATMPTVPVTDPSLKMWWTLDEGQGTNVMDRSGHEHHGVIDGTGAWSPEGYYGAALELDGRGRVNHAFSEQTWPAFTVALWAKATQTGQLVYASTFNNNSSGPDFQIDVDGTTPGNYRYYGSTGNEMFGAVTTDWVHLAASCDGTQTTLYYDGQSIATIDAADVNFGQFVIGANRANSKNFTGLIDDVYVYDKALTNEEIQQLMRGNVLLANDPNPNRSATIDIRDATALSWSAGAAAVSHDVYLGTSREAVANANPNSAEYQGNQPGTSFSLDGLLEMGGEYFWRIDEVEADETVQTGYIWSFSVPDYLIVDDFESYTNYSPDRVFQTWVDGIGFSADDHYPDGDPGNGTRALVGHDIWTSDSAHFEGQIMEIDDPYSGLQAMPLYYNNSEAPYYSEADRTWASAQDWTVEGMTDLTLYVRGASSNGAAPLYVALEDGAGSVAVVTHADTAILAETDWTEWKIPLAEFGGVNPASVTKMVIGVGNRTSPTADGSGVVYIDDIRVTLP